MSSASRDNASEGPAPPTRGRSLVLLLLLAVVLLAFVAAFPWQMRQWREAARLRRETALHETRLQELRAKYTDAEVAERHLKEAPGDPGAALEVARTLITRGDNAHALDFLRQTERAGRATPALRDDHALASALAGLYEQMGWQDRALFHAQRAVRLAPESPDALLCLAYLETALGWQADARRRAETAARLAPGAAEPRLVLALLLDQGGALSQAEDELKAAADRYVDDNLDHLDMPGMSCVTSDDEQGYRLTVEHLVGLGHRNIAFIAGNSVHPQDLLRKESYRRLMAERGLPVPEGSVLDSDWDLDQTERLTRQLFQDRSRRPTALICAGDKPAAVAMRTLGRLGLRVPEDVSVIGYSDFSFAALLDPPLTTIFQPFEEIGAVATRILLRRLQERSPEEAIASRVALPTKLIVRESTAAAPKGSAA